jgi:hypothetical protein
MRSVLIAAKLKCPLARRADGQIIPRHTLAGTKTQRELSPKDLEIAVQSKASIAQQQRRLREAGLLPSASVRPRCASIKEYESEEDST